MLSEKYKLITIEKEAALKSDAGFKIKVRMNIWVGDGISKWKQSPTHP